MSLREYTCSLELQNDILKKENAELKEKLSWLKGHLIQAVHAAGNTPQNAPSPQAG